MRGATEEPRLSGHRSPLQGQKPAHTSRSQEEGVVESVGLPTPRAALSPACWAAGAEFPTLAELTQLARRQGQPRPWPSHLPVQKLTALLGSHLRLLAGTWLAQPSPYLCVSGLTRQPGRAGVSEDRGWGEAVLGRWLLSWVLGAGVEQASWYMGTDLFQEPPSSSTPSPAQAPEGRAASSVPWMPVGSAGLGSSLLPGDPAFSS